MQLYTFSVSHFSEKIRWALDYAKLPYAERPLVPFFHVPTTLRLGGSKFTTVPILVAGKERIQDSTRILEWLAANRPPFALMPTEPVERAEAMALEARFDKMGAHIIRFAYAETLDNADGVLKLWTLDAKPWQARLLRLGYPALQRFFRKNSGISTASAQRAHSVVQENLDFIASRVSADSPYLVGGKFSAADLTAAALLAPLVCPDQHSVYSQADYRAGIAAQVAAWQTHPAFAWVRQIYALHRR